MEEVNALPPRWVEYYTRNGFLFADPVNRWVHGNTGWIRWSDIALPDPRGVLQAARAHGLVFGLAVSVANGDGRSDRSFAHFARADREFEAVEIELLQAEVERRHRALAPPTNVTRAEIEVLELVRDGLRQKEIAYRLGVSEGAIKQRLRNARQKLGATNAAQATSIARAFGLI